MNRDLLQDSLSHISDKYIAEAAAPKKPRYPLYISAIAAGLALILTLGLLLPKSGSNTSKAAQSTPTEDTADILPSQPVEEQTAFLPLLAAPKLPEISAFPQDYTDQDSFKAWQASRSALHSAPDGYADSLTDFWLQSIPLYLSSQEGENAAYSPISFYMALAMLTRAAEGTSRQELLTLLGADSMEALTRQAQYVFTNQYENDGVHTSILANSLWLDDAFSFQETAVTELAEAFYASVYRGALESPEMNAALKDWLNAQTGGLLEDSIANLQPMDAVTAMVMASTINYRCKWNQEFAPEWNTQECFYGTHGEKTVTYMNRTLESGCYYTGKNFSATYLSLDDGSRMWLVLPDETVSPETLLAQGDALNLILSDAPAEKKVLNINLSLPKFDISADLDLKKGMKELGLQEIMDPNKADFTGICDQGPGLYLGSASQGVRVSIDEVGLTGVAYTVIMIPEKGIAPNMEEVDFVLDRPFLFVVESSDGLPLFAGIVNNP